MRKKKNKENGKKLKNKKKKNGKMSLIHLL
jgi:hypothetical protein